jgi:hypothetical protein
LGILPWFWSWLASFLVMVWGGNFGSCSYRDCVHTGGEDPQPRSSMTWGPRGSGDDIAIVSWPCLTFYLSFHRINNQNLTPRSCIFSETVWAVRRDSRVMAVVGQSSSTSHRAEQFLMIMASRKLKLLQQLKHSVLLHAERSQPPAQSLRNQEDTLAESGEPSSTDGPNGNSSRIRETLNCNFPEVHGPDPTRSTPATEVHLGQIRRQVLQLLLKRITDQMWQEALPGWRV